MSTSLPAPDGTLPDRFTKPDTTVSIRIDGPRLKAYGADLAVTAAGIVLCPQTITPDYILFVELSVAPKYTIYRRPTEVQMEGVRQKTCVCPSCGEHHRNGAQWCLRCWEPMTWGALKERIQHISQADDPFARANELARVYGLTSKQ